MRIKKIVKIKFQALDFDFDFALFLQYLFFKYTFNVCLFRSLIMKIPVMNVKICDSWFIFVQNGSHCYQLTQVRISPEIHIL